ncbi:O-antigen ligase family protein [Flagellimonas meishanensis]|uniref:O-antigen ligase family protein n=1 Tax=Flagellimonas meishanensis TaxID=2873264 RepID=UPI001CA69BE4|nr:O-antigen ligase family protein [[Muricauda] meishanensis]
MLATSTLLVLYAIASVLERNKILDKKIETKAILFGAIPVLIALVALLRFGFQYYGLKELEKNITFLVLPIFCTTDYRNIKNLNVSIITSLFLGLVSLEIISTISFLAKNNFNTLSSSLGAMRASTYLSDYVDVHHSYFSVLLSIAILGVIYHYKSVKIPKTILNVLILFSIFYNVMLFARTPLVLFLGGLVAVAIIKEHFKPQLLIVFGVLICLLWMNRDSYAVRRIYLGSGNSDVENRVKLNRASWDVFLESPVFGVGPDRIRYERLDKYRELNHVAAYKYLYNSHNQYLNYLSVNGLFGLFLFLFMIVVTIYITWKEKQWFLLFSFLIFYLSCLAESYLARNKGIVILSFLMVLFLVSNSSVFRKNE